MTSYGDFLIEVAEKTVDAHGVGPAPYQCELEVFVSKPDVFSRRDGCGFVLQNDFEIGIARI